MTFMGHLETENPHIKSSNTWAIYAAIGNVKTITKPTQVRRELHQQLAKNYRYMVNINNQEWELNGLNVEGIIK